jgi:ribonuclease P protein component
MLPARFRLSHKKDFARVFQQGQYDAYREFAVKWQRGPSETSRIGFAAGKKIFPTAVLRNRAKRLAREAVRPYLERLRPGYDLIVFYRYRPERFVLKEGTRNIGLLLEKNNLLKHI